MKDISEKTVIVSEGNPENLKNAIIRILNNDEKKIVRLADIIKNIEENNRFLDEWLFKHKKKYPESAIDIHLEKVLGFILLNDYKTAYKIIRERTLKKDSGGFVSGMKNFYDSAAEYSELFVNAS